MGKMNQFYFDKQVFSIGSGKPFCGKSSPKTGNLKQAAVEKNDHLICQSRGIAIQQSVDIQVYQLVDPFNSTTCLASS